MTTPPHDVPSQEAIAAIPAVSLIAHIDARFAALERTVDERDRLYMTKFQESKDAVKDALAAQEKAVAAAFLTSEKAIVKAEDAQREYNVRSNEFRGQLDDQNKMQIPRAEALTLFRGIDEKIATLQRSMESRFESSQKQVDELRLSKASLEGKASQQAVNVVMLISIVGVLLAVFNFISRVSGG